MLYLSPSTLSHFTLQARKNLVAVFQSIVTERRRLRKDNVPLKTKDMMDCLLDAQDENGKKLTDEEIIDVLLMYLNAGHESSGHTMMWAVNFLQENPDVLQKAKVPCQELIATNLNLLICLA